MRHLSKKHATYGPRVGLCLCLGDCLPHGCLCLSAAVTCSQKRWSGPRGQRQQRQHFFFFCSRSDTSLFCPFAFLCPRHTRKRRSRKDPCNPHSVLEGTTLMQGSAAAPMNVLEPRCWPLSCRHQPPLPPHTYRRQRNENPGS